VQGAIVLSHLTASSGFDSFISTHRGGLSATKGAQVWLRLEGTNNYYSAVDSPGGPLLRGPVHGVTFPYIPSPPHPKE